MLAGWRERRNGPVERSLLGVATLLVLNAVVLVGSALVVTLPLALMAGMETAARWRATREEHIVASFFAACRREVKRKLLIGWSALALVAWGWVVVGEGLGLQGAWRIAIVALGSGELLVAAPLCWMALLLAWSSAGNARAVLWAALLLAWRLPLRSLACLGLSLLLVVVSLVDPGLLLVGVVAGVVWAIEVLEAQGLARLGIVVDLPEA